MPIEAASTYSKGYIKKLYSSGLAAQLLFGNIQDKADKKSSPYEHENNNFNKNEFDSKKELLNLFKLLCFIQAWSDPIENWSGIDEFEIKKIRQLTKFKKNINKPIRRLIHLGLYKLVCENLFQFEQVATAEEAESIKRLLQSLEKIYNDADIDSDTKKQSLIGAIGGFLVYKKFELPSEYEKIFLEAAKSISAFSFWSDKLLYSCGIGLGLIAALACGLSTGGAIFILLIGFSLPLGLVIPLSLLIFLAGTKANFQLFSQHIPNFFQDLCKNGGVTEFIDRQGKRLQLPVAKKFLLLPAGFLSLSVGTAAAAITYLEGTKMIALICPMLAATCPHLTIALLGLLASVLLIGLTIVMFRTFIGVLQSQFSWQDLKKDIKEKWQNLNFTKGLGYVFKALIMLAVIFGLVYLYFTGTATLAGLLGWVAADAITLAAIIGDLPFTLKTVLAWYDDLFKSDANPNSDLQKSRAYYFWKTLEILALIINALGNAALVFAKSLVSCIASIICFLISYASNRSQENDSALNKAREDATQNSINTLTQFFSQPSPEAQEPEATNDKMLIKNCSSANFASYHS